MLNGHSCMSYTTGFHDTPKHFGDISTDSKSKSDTSPALISFQYNTKLVDNNRKRNDSSWQRDRKCRIHEISGQIRMIARNDKWGC